MATVKDRVAALCKQHNITINKLQNETGIGNVVSRWDVYTPKLNKLQAVADYFHVPVEVLTGTKSIDDYLPTDKTSMMLNDIQEIEVIDMLRRLDTVSRYYIVGKIAELLREQEKQDRIEVVDPSDEDMAEGALSTSKVG